MIDSTEYFDRLPSHRRNVLDHKLIDSRQVQLRIHR